MGTHNTTLTANSLRQQQTSVIHVHVMACKMHSTRYKIVENRVPLFVAKQIPLTRLPLTTVCVDDVGIQKSCFQVMQHYRKIMYNNDHNISTVYNVITTVMIGKVSCVLQTGYRKRLCSYGF